MLPGFNSQPRGVRKMGGRDDRGLTAAEGHTLDAGYTQCCMLGCCGWCLSCGCAGCFCCAQTLSVLSCCCSGCMWSASKWTPYVMAIASEDFSAWLDDVRAVLAHAQVRQGPSDGCHRQCLWDFNMACQSGAATAHWHGCKHHPAQKQALIKSPQQGVPPDARLSSPCPVCTHAGLPSLPLLLPLCGRV